MKVDLTLEQATTIAGLNRYLVDGLPLKTYDCSQITDGYARHDCRFRGGSDSARGKQV